MTKKEIARQLVNQYREYEEERFVLNEKIHDSNNDADTVKRHRRNSAQLLCQMAAVKTTKMNLEISSTLWDEAVDQWQIDYANRNIAKRAKQDVVL